MVMAQHVAMVSAPILIAVGALIGIQSAPQFGSRVELVVLSVVVTDKTGKFVPSLDKSRFEIVENGTPVSISTFAQVEADTLAPQDDGRFVVLMLDDLVTQRSLASRIKTIAHAFANRMGPRDVISVVFLNGGSGSSSGRAIDVRATINRFRPFGDSLMGGFAAKRHAMEAIEGLAAQLAGVRHRRKVLVCIGPAPLFNQQLGEGDGDPFIRRAIAAAARADLTTYVIDPTGLVGSGAATAAVKAGLDGFVRETGGAVFSNVNEFEAPVSQVWRESGDYYVMGYVSNEQGGGRHAVDVRVRSQEWRVRARRSR